LQAESSNDGDPGLQVSTTVPVTQVVPPRDEQAPTPQLVGTATKSSSAAPSQSSSRPLQTASSPAGVPGVHESTTDPDTQEVDPLAAHAPTPQLVGVET
jgi:hypothetical protein